MVVGEAHLHLEGLADVGGDRVVGRAVGAGNVGLGGPVNPDPLVAVADIRKAVGVRYVAGPGGQRLADLRRPRDRRGADRGTVRGGRQCQLDAYRRGPVEADVGPLINPVGVEVRHAQIKRDIANMQSQLRLLRIGKLGPVQTEIEDFIYDSNVIDCVATESRIGEFSVT